MHSSCYAQFDLWTIRSCIHLLLGAGADLSTVCSGSGSGHIGRLRLRNTTCHTFAFSCHTLGSSWYTIDPHPRVFVVVYCPSLSCHAPNFFVLSHYLLLILCPDPRCSLTPVPVLLPNATNGDGEPIQTGEQYFSRGWSVDLKRNHVLLYYRPK